MLPCLFLSHRLAAGCLLIQDKVSQEGVLVGAPLRLSSLHMLEPAQLLQGMDLRALILTEGHLLNAARAAELAHRYGLPIWAPASILPQLHGLLREAKAAGLCGVKTPVITRFLEDESIIELGRETSTWKALKEWLDKENLA